MTPLQRLRALLDASTPGDWEVYSEPDVGMPPTLMALVPYEDRALKFLRRPMEPLSEEDMAFIAAARNQMDRLLAVAEAIEKQHREYPTQIGLAPFVLRALLALQSTENTDE